MLVVKKNHAQPRDKKTHVKNIWNKIQIPCSAQFWKLDENTNGVLQQFNKSFKEAKYGTVAASWKI